MKKVKKLTSVLLATVMMIVFAQSAFADYYTNPNGSTGTAITMAIGSTVNSQIGVPLETDYFKINTGTNKNVKVTLKSPCTTFYTGPHYEYVNVSCLNFDVAVFKVVDGVISLVTNATYTQGGSGGTDIVSFNTSGSTQFYIKVYGHPPTSIGTNPLGQPIYNYNYSAASSYQLKAVYN
ncbi:hypothetical protein [Cohnella panacarvi]|uniref:hypothetical protein n=1 Tax=Cohnella panacarvi TaxID=400776 RepID=UPI000478ABA1|nr:hypothetical protein [Cohnella panacarvi]